VPTSTVSSFYSISFPVTIPSSSTVTINSGFGVNILSGQTLTNDGRIENFGTIGNVGIINSFVIINVGIINNSGDISNSGSINNTGTINNDGDIKSILSSSIIGNQSGTINNNTTGLINNVGTISNTSRFGPTGLINNDGDISNSGPIINSGTISNSGIITNSGTITNLGTIDNLSGATISILSGGTINNNSGTINRTGTIDFRNNSGKDFGIIIDLADQKLEITEETRIRKIFGIKRTLSAVGVAVSGGASPATVDACSNSQYRDLNDGEKIKVGCGSVDVEVVSGEIIATFVADDGSTAEATLDTGDVFFFDDATFTLNTISTVESGDVQIIIEADDGTKTEISLTTDNAITVFGSMITADPDNPTDVTITIDGEETTITPGGSAVSSPEQAVQRLVSDVEALVAAGVLEQGQRNSLNRKLEAAIQHLEKDRVRGACGKLTDFIAQVDAFIKNGILTPDEGEPLRVPATNLRIALGC